MNQKKTAILIDSGTDVPDEYIKRFDMHMVPLKIIYRDHEYDDRVEITAQEVYDRLSLEIPSTSLPDNEKIENAFNSIIAGGYKEVLCVNISSALSGTGNAIRLAAENYRDRIKILFIDTKNIGLGAGLQAILAGKLIEEGHAVEMVYEKILQSVRESKTFFCLSTLEYLAKGGRIGKVSAVLGSLLHIKPIITCNAEGAYVIASKIRGRARSIAEMITLAVAEANKHFKYSLAVVQGDAIEEAKQVLSEIKRLLPDCGLVIESGVSPALVVHTGPGLIGIVVQSIPS